MIESDLSVVFGLALLRRNERKNMYETMRRINTATALPMTAPAIVAGEGGDLRPVLDWEGMPGGVGLEMDVDVDDGVVFGRNVSRVTV